jgi:hypothetical protein
MKIKENKMNKMTKMLLVITSSFAMSFAAVAGDLNVTGSVKASYLINGGGSNNNGVGLGVSNELKFSASGEMDNGYTWNYHTEIDPAGGGAASNDDTAVTINTNGMGTIGICDSECGLSQELGWGIGALGTGQDYASVMGAAGTNGALQWGSDVSSDANIQYHLPADMLPFGMGFKVGYVPNLADGQGNDFKSSGAENTQGPTGDSAVQYQLTGAPIDGLKVGADYYEGQNESGVNDQEQSGGNVFAQYAFGNFKVGYMTGMVEKGKATYANGDGTSFDRYEYDAVGVEFAVNDNLSLSVSKEDHEATDKGQIADATATMASTKVTAETKTYQIAYNMGGATVGLFHNDTENAEYSTGKEATKTILSIAMEF